MTEPTQPKDPPAPEQKTETDPHGHSPNGVPPQADQAAPTGTPSSDRHETETAAKPS